MAPRRDIGPPPGSGAIRFRALGALEVRSGAGVLNVGGPRQRRLVAMLLIHRDQVVSVDRIAEAVFAGEPTPGAATTLRSYVARLRRVIEGDGGACVVTQAPGYALRLPDAAFDVAEVEALLDDARAARARDDAWTAAALLQDALALWRGDPYAEFAHEDWAQPEAQRLAELRLAALEQRFDAELACGRGADLVAELEAATRANPWREGLRGQLMLALYRAGRQGEALRAYQAHREALAEELGLDPGPGLRALEERILGQDPELLPAGPGEPTVRGYRLGERLGTGQDGTVHAARLPGVDRDVVLRTLHPDVADAPELVRSFDSTMRRVAALHHGAIVPVHDHWREPGRAHVVLRRLHGGSLADRLEHGPLAPDAVVALVRRIGGALVAAHAAGLHHGAVTARNVLHDDAGDPYLTDFAVPGMATTGRDDVQDLALVVRCCLGGSDLPDVRAVLDPVAAGLARPDADALVDRLLGVLSDERVSRPLANPYKGLRAFDEGDAADYHGRDGLVDELVTRLGGDGLRSRLLLVVGGSGTGKSSAVRAGLLPRIRRGDVPGSQRWFATAVLPGPEPFTELAVGLRRITTERTATVVGDLSRPGALHEAVRLLVPEDGQLLLVVDQLEELFTAAPEDQQRPFLDALLDAVEAPESRLRVVATLRADFFDRPLAFHRFGAVVEEATVPIPAMSPAEIEAAIVEPARRAGRRVDWALVAELVAAVADEPGALPALQFALFELAERCGPALTTAAYRELGGVDGAIAARAEDLYRSLDEHDRSAVRTVFEELVTVGPGLPPSRRVVPRAELVDGPDAPVAGVLLDQWAEARLLTLDRHRETRAPTVEVAHEALLHEWPRLRRWIEEDHDRLVVLAALREAAAGWEALERDPGALYRGARLQAALAVTERAAGLAPRERVFLDASRAQAAADEAAAADQLVRQSRANRRLRAQLVLIAVALFAALVGGLVAVDQQAEADEQRRIAIARELASAAAASVAEDPERAVLLALAALEAPDDLPPRPEAIDALHRAVTSSRIVLSVPGIGGATDWSPDGALFVTEGPEESGLVDLRDARTGASVRAFTGHRIDINDVGFGPGGRLLATAGDDGALRVWEAATGDEVFTADGDDQPVWGVSFSPDGTRVAASWHEDAVVRAFDVRTGRLIAELEGIRTETTAFGPDGTQLLVAPGDAPATVVDLATGDPVRSFDDLGLVRQARWSPDGGSVAIAGSDGTAVVWDLATGRRRATITAHAGAVNAVDWSRDGALLATGSDDGTARVHELLEGGARQTHVLTAVDMRNGVRSVAFSPDGDRLMTADGGIAAVKVWDVGREAGGELAVVAGVPDAPGGAFLPGGREIVGPAPGGGIAVWNARTGHRDRLLRLPEAGTDELRRMALSPDGAVVAGTTDRSPVHLWTVRDGRQVAAVAAGTAGCTGPGPEAACPFVADLAWSPDGRLLAIAEASDDLGGAVTVVDRSGALVSRFSEEQGVFVRDVAFSPDGTLLATTRAAPRDDPARQGFRIWDVRTGDPLRRVSTQALTVDWDRSGSRLVTTRQSEGGADVWDAETGEPVARLRAGAPFHTAAFAPTGDQVATGGSDGVIRVWSTETGVQELALHGHARSIEDLRYRADGTLLSSLDDEGTIRVWTLDLDDLIDIARWRVTRGLTDDECRQHLHLERCPDWVR